MGPEEEEDGRGRSLTANGDEGGENKGLNRTNSFQVLEYVDDLEETDHVFDSDGFKIVVDPKSLPILDGLIIDYVRNGLNEGFEFINQKERDRCGCGESFRV
jgi:iron-sulfur cluster assembly protein